MISLYELRLYDETLLTFSMAEKGLEGLVAEIDYINNDKLNLFPLDLEVSNTGIIKWLRNRVIPKRHKRHN